MSAVRNLEAARKAREKENDEREKRRLDDRKYRASWQRRIDVRTATLGLLPLHPDKPAAEVVRLAKKLVDEIYKQLPLA